MVLLIILLSIFSVLSSISYYVGFLDFFTNSDGSPFASLAKGTVFSFLLMSSFTIGVMVELNKQRGVPTEEFSWRVILRIIGGMALQAFFVQAFMLAKLGAEIMKRPLFFPVFIGIGLPAVIALSVSSPLPSKKNGLRMKT